MSAPTIPAEGDTEAGRVIRATRASLITMRAVRWLWEEPPEDSGFIIAGARSAQWLPLGGLCLLGGREGTGKSTWGYRVAAKLTNGTLHGAFYGKPRAVAVAATEDAWAQTIVPRLVAAGATLDRVFRVEAVEDGFSAGLTLPADTRQLEQLCEKEQVALLLLDPLMGAISGALDSHKDHDVRVALEPLSRLAHDAQLTILGLIHVNKSTGADLLTRLMASRAFSAVARAVLFASREEPEEGRQNDAPSFLIGQAKNNLGAEVPYSLRYHIEGVKVGFDDELWLDIWSSKIEIDEKISTTVNELVRAQENRAPERETAADRAEKWLRDHLSGRGYVPSLDVKAAAEQAGHKPRTIDRVRADLGLLVASIQGTTRTAWALPESGVDGVNGADGVDGVNGADPQTGSKDMSTPSAPTTPAPARGGAEAGVDETAYLPGFEPKCWSCKQLLRTEKERDGGQCVLCDHNQASAA